MQLYVDTVESDGMGQNKEFSLYEIEQFIREEGAERVSEDAVRELEREIEKLADTLAKKAMTYAGHAGRKKLIRTADVMLTRKMESPYRTPANFSHNPRITKPASNAVK